jgi:hypothetical protein
VVPLVLKLPPFGALWWAVCFYRSIWERTWERELWLGFRMLPMVEMLNFEGGLECMGDPTPEI